MDQALRTLDQAGMPAALVNGGGDLAAFGRPGPGRAGGPDPPSLAGAGLAAVVEVHGAVATSASYERGAHLVDPRTGQPGCRAASATVTGPSLALADALATGLAVGGDAALEVISGLAGYQAYLIRPDGSESCTPGMEFASGSRPGAPECPRTAYGCEWRSASAADAAAVQRGSKSHMTVQHEGALHQETRARPRRVSS